MDSSQLSELIARLAWEKKGQDVTILDLRELTDVSDFFVIVTVESDPQARAIADYIERRVREEGIRIWHKEGQKNMNWILMDYIEVVVHIFRPQSREFYALEKLWGDAPMTRLEEDVPDRIVSEK